MEKSTQDQKRSLTLQLTSLQSLSTYTPLQLVEELHQAYTGGSGKGGSKFHNLRRRLTTVLPTAPPPGAAAFAERALEVATEPGSQYDDGLSHLILTAYQHLPGNLKTAEDAENGRHLASILFLRAITKELQMDARVLVRLVTVFQVELRDLESVVARGHWTPRGGSNGQVTAGTEGKRKARDADVDEPIMARRGAQFQASGRDELEGTFLEGGIGEGSQEKAAAGNDQLGWKAGKDTTETGDNAAGSRVEGEGNWSSPKPIFAMEGDESQGLAIRGNEGMATERPEGGRSLGSIDGWNEHPGLKKGDVRDEEDVIDDLVQGSGACEEGPRKERGTKRGLVPGMVGIGRLASATEMQEDGSLGLAAEMQEQSLAANLVENFVHNLIKKRAYTSAVAVMKQLGLKAGFAEKTLVSMVADGQSDVAADWANLLGRDKCHFLVKCCLREQFYKVAYRMVQRYGMEEDYPDAYILYRRSSLKRLVGKGLWDVAESMAADEKRLQEYMVTLALQNGEADRANSLCAQYGLEDFEPCQVLEAPLTEVEYLKLTDMIPEENLLWVDNCTALEAATRQLANAPEVGLDCEWRPRLVKGEEDPKVATLQVASRDHAYVIDVIGLGETAPEALNDFIAKLFHSPQTLKLGYMVKHDLARLASSYPHVSSFQRCHPVLDLQQLTPKGIKGGLAELTKKTLGLPLDKHVRMSDWEQRPLTNRQLEYAGMDSLCLVRIFDVLKILSEKKSTESSDASTWQSKVYTFEARQPQKSVSSKASPSNPLPPDFAEATLQKAGLRRVRQPFAQSQHSKQEFTASPGGQNLQETSEKLPSERAPGEKDLDSSFLTRSTLPPVQNLEGVSGTFPVGTASEGMGLDHSNQANSNAASDQPGGSGQVAARGGNLVDISEMEYAVLTEKQAEQAANQQATCVPYLVLSPPVPGQMKSLLQEVAHKMNIQLPSYSTVAEGRDHFPHFHSTVRLGGTAIQGPPALRKKAAEGLAAELALGALGIDPAIRSHSSDSARGVYSSSDDESDTEEISRHQIPERVLAVVLSGKQVDVERLEEWLQRPTRIVRPASNSESFVHFGHEMDRLPPLGLRSSAKVLLDDKLWTAVSQVNPLNRTILVASGRQGHFLAVDLDVLTEITGGEIVKGLGRFPKGGKGLVNLLEDDGRLETRNDEIHNRQEVTTAAYVHEGMQSAIEEVTRGRVETFVGPNSYAQTWNRDSSVMAWAGTEKFLEVPSVAKASQPAVKGSASVWGVIVAAAQAFMAALVQKMAILFVNVRKSLKQGMRRTKVQSGQDHESRQNAESMLNSDSEEASGKLLSRSSPVSAGQTSFQSAASATSTLFWPIQRWLLGEAQSLPLPPGVPARRDPPPDITCTRSCLDRPWAEQLQTNGEPAGAMPGRLSGLGHRHLCWFNLLLPQSCQQHRQQYRHRWVPFLFKFYSVSAQTLGTYMLPGVNSGSRYGTRPLLQVAANGNTTARHRRSVSRQRQLFTRGQVAGSDCARWHQVVRPADTAGVCKVASGESARWQLCAAANIPKTTAFAVKAAEISISPIFRQHCGRTILRALVR